MFFLMLITIIYPYYYNLAVPCDEEGNDLLPGTPPPPREKKSQTDWTPFQSRNQYEMAEFLFTDTEMAAGKVDRFMQIFAAHSAPDGRPPPFDGHEDLKRHIDAIDLNCVSWEQLSVNFSGKKPLQTPPWMKKEYEVWYRDPCEVVHNILANEDFHGKFDYRPYCDD